MKLKTVYICANCSFQSTKWQGKCPECSQWNSFNEDVINVGKNDITKGVVRARTALSPQKISNIEESAPRVQTLISEFDTVTGGGIVEGSLILLSGEPGIGKSTLTLQIVDRMAAQKEKVLYITGEESISQVSSRAKRLSLKNENIALLYETNLENILLTLESEKPEFLVLDSVQVMASTEIPGSAGSLSQVRYVTEAIMNHIKTNKIATLLIGHVNKDGNIAGPKVLEHLVDTVLLIEGERDHSIRSLRAVKNRFGPVSEVGLFEMKEEGMMEVSNPSELVLSERPKNSFGTCLTMTINGNRPLLMEVQALVNRTPFGYPKRTASGFDRNRLELLIAVLQKHTNLNFSDQDVYLNVVGGLRLQDPGADLAVCMALSSSFQKKPLPENLVAFGEIGLTGEIRPAFRQKERAKAVEKLKLQNVKEEKLLNQIISS
ncbi:DNA repair protein RadA [Patescibacteria group bacterium]|nr:DNA repair protein RadA [Patescibacteria group bacterium]